jgi:hydrogenase maturation protein HypF
MTGLQSGRIHISGIVQGVGFRPFVYQLATRLGVLGFVRNTSAGVDIEVEGERVAIEAFVHLLQSDSPPLAIIDELTFQPQEMQGYSGFEIIHSQPVPGAYQPISPDYCVCQACLTEMHTPSDRRYLYPFINCTNCGPRFTIITDIPYDRPNTTMASFELCPECAAEYSQPLDRRFHAQPVACPVCGPQVWVEYADVHVGNPQNPAGHEQSNKQHDFIPSSHSSRNPFLTVQRLLAAGKIVAIKGLGGFHLACDATNPDAVAVLRQRKMRIEKPFALMMPDLAMVETHCITTSLESELLESCERPIVILKRRPGTPIVKQVAPKQDTLGVMLPYTPLHHLLFDSLPGSSGVGPPQILVMTSGNLGEEPIATDNEEARLRLSTLADAFLMHDRLIQTRCDDSVVRVVEIGKELELLEAPEGQKPRAVVQHYRRSRGYAPKPIHLAWETPVILGTGAEQKNTFCFTRERYAFFSHHIGDLQNYETLLSYTEGIEHFERLFRLKPQAIAYDLHPDYLATRYAIERAEREGLPSSGIQHHHSHIAACMADNHLPPERVVLGVSFDGTGLGTDGAIWGGEFLLAGFESSPQFNIGGPGFLRMAHLSYMPLPGGDAAIRKPARIALAYLWKAGIAWDSILTCLASFSDQERSILHAQLEQRLNTPLTSSMGRLFDAVASLAGVRQEINYEAQAAIELEALADPDETVAYPFDIRASSGDGACYQIDPAPLFEEVVKDIRQGCSPSAISARFHNGCARMVVNVCQELRKITSIGEVALSGGVWQNNLLLRKAVLMLERDGFTVYIHQRIPPNDGGLALGQAVIAGRRLINQEL